MLLKQHNVLIMRPGTGEIVVILDTHAELEAIEVGLFQGGVAFGDDPSLASFEQQWYRAGRDLDFSAGSVVASQLEKPELEITPDNLKHVRSSLEATVAMGGLNGLRAVFAGNKRTARKILRTISSTEA
jgi:hypothetical protein